MNENDEKNILRSINTDIKNLTDKLTDVDNEAKKLKNFLTDRKNHIKKQRKQEKLLESFLVNIEKTPGKDQAETIEKEPSPERKFSPKKSGA